MNNKGLMVLLIIFLMFGFINVVNADGSAELPKDEGSPILQEIMEQYNTGRGKVKTIDSENQLITVYGKSVCTTSSAKCEYTYYGTTNDIEQYFRTYLKCSNGATKVGYEEEAVAASTKYKGAYSGTSDIEAYWHEEYTVSCLTDSANSTYDNTLDLNASGGTSSDISDDTSGGTVSGDFPSSDGTVENENTGVFTYYIVLFVIAIGSYILLLVSKKYNLFKKI